MRYALGKSFFEHFDEFVVKKITLGDGKYTLLVEHIGIERSQFIEQYIVLLAYVLGIAGHHEEQQ